MANTQKRNRGGGLANLRIKKNTRDQALTILVSAAAFYLAEKRRQSKERKERHSTPGYSI
jgi:hypothetical protein